MSAVIVDIRLLRKGLKWCATARVTAPSLRGPVSLYACQDVREALSMFQKTFGSVELPKQYLAKASAEARKRVRREILGLTYNLLSDLSQDLKSGATKMQETLEACDKACDLVHQSRAGNVRAKKTIETIFLRAKGGDKNADRSAKLIVEAADLVDDGRAGFRVTMVAPSVPMLPARQRLMMPSASTGAENKELALYYPGTTVPNVNKPDISPKDLELMLQDPFEYVPYPASSSDRYNIQQTLEPAIAAF